MVVIIASLSLTVAACGEKEEDIPVEGEIEEVDASVDDALADAIENAESSADAMGQELLDATAPEVSAPAEENETDDAQ